MEKYTGEVASKGISKGEIYYFQKKNIKVLQKKITNIEKEIEKYKEAFFLLKKDFTKLQKKAEKTFDKKTAEIFSAYLTLLEDEVFRKEIENKIILEKTNAEYAIQNICEGFAKRFFKLEDIYMRERGNDILHLSHRLLSAIKLEKDKTEQLKSPVILIASDLDPSELFQLNHEMIQGIILFEGSVYSHTRVIAEIMNIPMLVNVNGIIGEKIKGQYGIINAEEGKFYINPDKKTIENIEAKQEKSRIENESFKKMIGKATSTLDGKKINLYANISCLFDLKQAILNDAEGIGLLRSEGLFMQEAELPSEETQFIFYKKIAEQMKEKTVIIRTLDIGADKKIPYLPMEEEKNPAIGMRGIRYAFLHSEILKVQLRAILRASLYGNVSVLYPMITSVWEVEKLLQIMKDVKQELMVENIPYGDILQGIMIETPAAALCSADLAKKVDFFSLGTNDLTQHTLAMDRQNMQLVENFNEKHPAVIKLIKMTVYSAHQAGIPIGICGELGGNLSFLKEMVAMKMDSISVVPSKILEIRDTIRKLDLSK